MSATDEQLQANNQAAGLDEDGSSPKEQFDLDLILDIPLDVTVELGNAKMPVNELLQLGQGSIVELTKPVGDHLDIYVNNKLIAKGEVVIVDEKFGIRVADIINPIERVKSLG